MSLNAREAAARLRRLAETLATLKHRVREAVAGETSRAVGEAVRDLLAAALAGSPPAPSRSRRRDDEPDDWREAEGRFVPAAAARWSDPDAPRPPRAARWSAAFAFGAAAVHGGVLRRLPAGGALVLGAAAGCLAWLGGNLAQVALRLFGAVADLFPSPEPATFSSVLAD